MKITITMALLLLALCCTSPTEPQPQYLSINYSIDWSQQPPAAFEVIFCGTWSASGGFLEEIFSVKKPTTSGVYRVLMEEVDEQAWTYIYCYNGGYGVDAYVMLTRPETSIHIP